MWAVLGLLALGAQVAMPVEEVSGVGDDEQRAILAGLTRAVEARGHAMDTGDADTLLQVRLIGIPTRVRVIVARVDRGAAPEAPVARAQADLLRDGTPWDPALSELIAALFPAAPAEAAPAPPPPPPVLEPAAPALEPPTHAAAPPLVPARAALSPDPEPSRVLPLALLGAGALALSVGLVLGAMNKSAVDEGRVSSDPARVDVLRDRTFATGLGANILFGTALLSGAAGATLLLLE